MNYTVGQILFVVLRKEARVYPMQVAKRLTEETLEGEVVTYMARAGSTPDKLIPLTQIDGEIFDSAEKAKRILIDRVTTSISTMVDNAIAKAHEWYPTGKELVNDDPMALLTKPVSVTEQLMQTRQQASRPKATNPALAEFQAEMRAEARGDIIELPDGTKARIRNVNLPPALQG
jgi:hypothetical protein